MSRFNFSDYADQSMGSLDAADPLTQLRRDLDDIDFPENLSFENPGLMSSDFFDSVLSMEQSDFESNAVKEPTSNMDSDLGLSSDGDELQFINSCSPVSGTSSSDYEPKDFILMKEDSPEHKNEEVVINYLNQPEEQYMVNNIKTLQTPTKVYLNSPNVKKVILTKPHIIKTNRTVPNTKQILRVQSISGNGRSVLLPFNVAKVKNIKFVNASGIQAENIKITKVAGLRSPQKPYTPPVRKTYAESYEASSPETIDEDSDSLDAKSDIGSQYPALVLTEEEKRLLSKEGISLPTHYPLTKQEERELKRIRRKIRNKISAQDSRKRKKEYVDGLEERIKQGVEEKKMLLNHVKKLQQQNSKLIAQMNKLQALVFNTSGSKATPTTCLLIVLVSALLISLPNLRVPQNKEWKDQQQVAARRALLSSQQATNEDTVNMEEFASFGREDDSDFKSSLFEEDNNTGEFSFSKFLNGCDKKYEGNGEKLGGKEDAKKLLDCHEVEKDIRNTFMRMKNFMNQELGDLQYDYNSNEMFAASCNTKKFIEPDIDDGPDIYGSVAKKIKLEESEIGDHHITPNSPSNVVSAKVAVNDSKTE